MLTVLRLEQVDPRIRRDPISRFLNLFGLQRGMPRGILTIGEDAYQIVGDIRPLVCYISADQKMVLDAILIGIADDEVASHMILRHIHHTTIDLIYEW